MKNIKWFSVMVLLIVVQSACNLPVSSTENPVKPQGIDVNTPSSATLISTPAGSNPNPNFSQITQTTLPLAAATFTNTVADTSIPSLSETPVPTQPVDSVFSSINLSNQVIFQACDPKTVHFQVTPIDTSIYSVVFFFRIRYKVNGEKTSWSEGYAMQPIGGKFVYDLKSSSLNDFNKFKEPVAWVQFQLVTTDSHGRIIARSQVYTDKLTISSICP